METSELCSKSYDSYTKQEDEVCNELNKSELDIEIEMCEELLSSDCIKRDFTEMINFDKENLSELSEETSSRKKPKIEILKSRNGGPCKNCLNYENVENHLSKENNFHLKFILNVSEENNVNPLPILSEGENSTVMVEVQNVEKCEEVSEIHKKNITTSLSDCQETSNNYDANISRSTDLENQDIENNTVKVEFKEDHLDIVPAIINIKSEEVNEIPIENMTTLLSNCQETSSKCDANTSRSTDLEDQDIENNTLKVEFKDQHLDIVPAVINIKCEEVNEIPIKNITTLLSDCQETSSNCDANTPKNTDLENQDIENNNTVKVEFRSQPLDHGFENDTDSTKFALDEQDAELSLLVETDDSMYEVSILDVTNENQDIENNNTVEVVFEDKPLIKCSTESVECSTELNDQCFQNNIDSTKLALNEKDAELSLFVDADDSMYEVSILDVTNNEETSNESEIILSSIKMEDKTAFNDIAKVLEKPQEQIKDDEKEDLLDPRWDTIKKLTTDEERYQQVKTCWKSGKIPDPNKNLTYHSFRKRQFKDTIVNQPKQRKRMATNNLNDKSAKRSRTCTYHLDNHIQTVTLKKKTETNKIRSEMEKEISRVNRSFQQEAQRHFDPIMGYNSYAFGQLQANLENKIASIRNQYSEQENYCINQGKSEMHSLKIARSEVLQFYKFYKGLNNQNDPTVLTLEQNFELEEIEKIYSKFNYLYK